MKTVFTNRELAHVWAQQKQQHGRGHNFFFDGPSIYSYGRHFEIARFDPKHDCVLFTTARYSQSTSKHISYARNAISHKTVFCVSDIAQPAFTVEVYLKEIDKRLIEVVKGTKRLAAGRIADLSAFIDRAENFATLYKKEIGRPLCLKIAKWKIKRIDGKLLDEKTLATIKAGIKTETAANKIRNAEKRAAAAARAIEDAKTQAEVTRAWLAGESNRTPNYAHGAAVLLRIKDKRIETSRGAQITLRAAIDLWAKLVAGESPIGIVLDELYTVNAWDGQVITVGCHNIAAAEVAKLAAVLKLPGTLPALGDK